MTSNKPFWERELPNPKEVIVGELAERGEWIVASIQPSSYWPIETQRIEWRGRVMWVIPVMKGFFPAVAIRVTEGLDRLACEELIMRFLSNLSWVQGHGYMVEALTGGSLPAPMARGGERPFAIAEEFDLQYFPEPDNERALLALALMREGRGLNHPAYAFLSFFRVLEVALPHGRRRQRWIETALPDL